MFRIQDRIADISDRYKIIYDLSELAKVQYVKLEKEINEKLTEIAKKHMEKLYGHAFSDVDRPREDFPIFHILLSTEKASTEDKRQKQLYIEQDVFGIKTGWSLSYVYSEHISEELFVEIVKKIATDLEQAFEYEGE